ncbi:MAG: 30S ribosomal protein S20 [Acidimicrobiia bacterium]|nr:30S ribosomal protein S20 [Acidimicrobiia bacterium]
MANIKQQKKRNRQSEAARMRNKSIRSEIKTAMRRLDEAIAEGDADAISERARDAQKKIGVAGRKGVLHKSTVARRQSRLAKRVNTAADA